MDNPKKSNGIKHILKAIASAFVWGLGQLLNKQFIKALFFFLFMVLLVTIELVSGSYFTNYDPYSDLSRFQGGSIEAKSAEYGFSDNLINIESGLYDRGLKNDEAFSNYYISTKEKNGAITMADLVAYTANNLSINNPEKFTNVLSSSVNNSADPDTYTYLRYSNAVKEGTDIDYSKYQVLDIVNEYQNDNAVYIPRFETIFVSKETGKIYYEQLQGIGASVVRTYVSVDGKETLSVEELFGYTTQAVGNTTHYSKDGGKTNYIRRAVEGGLPTKTRFEFVNVDRATNVISESDFYNCKCLTKDNVFYKNSTNDKLYIELSDEYSDSKEYLDLSDYDVNIYPVDDTEKVVSTTEGLSKVTVSNDIYAYEGNIYEHFDPEVITIGYQPTNYSRCLQDAFEMTFNGFGGEQYTQADFTKFLLRVYFEINADAKNDFEKRFDNFFNDQAGFFVKGIWSVITLGQTDREEYNEQTLVYTAIPILKSNQKFLLSNLPIQGHTSTYLLITGIISTLVLMFFAIVWIWGIKDAYKTSIDYETTGVKINSKQYFKTLYESAFEYIVLLPAIIIIVFISIMPIIFSFLIAFTNYKSNVRLVDWVGLENFVAIFSFGQIGDISIPYGTVFWKVLIWTVIWAIGSTVTVFFGGFAQALIINNERVPFKKVWRTVLILPWAIPALITQMTFSIIFQETGIINSVLQNIGVYDVLKDIGILGVKYQDYTSSFLRMFYLGESNIQWFTNPYNKWFVRITLIVVNIWLGFPYYMALMSGVMTSIDKTLYEAAEIDGATKGQRFKHVTFPLVMYSTAPLLVMAFSGNFNNFGMIYFVTGGGAHAGDISYAYAGDTDILISWMYSLTVDEKIYNMASVFSILIFIVIGSVAAWNYAQTKAFKED